MKVSKIQQRVNNAAKGIKRLAARPTETPVVEEGFYGKWGWEGPNKADKGKRLGSCNVTRCQREGAFWYNKGMNAWYCGACARGINYRPLDDGTYLCTIDKEAEAEFFGDDND